MECKKIIKELVPILPDLSLMEKLGRGAGYSLSQAVGEFIDNSIDDRDTDKQLLVKIIFNLNGEGSSIEIQDNALGMDRSGLIDAAVLGKSKKKEKLGEFGIGLKSGALSQGKKFLVKTAKKDTPFYSIEFDLNQWEKNKEWKIPFTTEEKTADEKNFYGTTIIIQDLNKDCFFPIENGKIKSFVNDLAKSYSPYLPESLKLKIEVNKYISTPKAEKKVYICEPMDIPLSEKEEFKNIRIHNFFIHGWIGLLEKPKGDYGFNTFRYNKLIEGHSKIGLASTTPRFSFHDRYIVGVINMNLVPVTSTKREWNKNSKAYREVEKWIRKLVIEWREKARIQSEKESVDKRFMKIPRKQLQYVIKELIGAVKATSSLDLSSLGVKYEQNPSGHIDGMEEIESREKKKVEEEEREKKQLFKKSKISKKRVSKKTHPVKRIFVKVGGIHYKFEIHFFDLGDKAPCKVWDRDEVTGIVNVKVNTAFPVYEEIKSKKGLLFLVAKYIAEVICESIYGKRLIEIRDRLLSPTLVKLKKLKL